MNLDELIADPKQKRDELQVQVNLGTRELEDEVNEEWEEFQQKLKKFNAKAELAETREEIGEELADDIKRGFDRLTKAFKD